MTRYSRKRDFPVAEIRRYLEPGPIVLVSSAHGGQRNIMTMGWHTMMEFTPALIGCIIASSNHSFGLIRGSGECVINLPTAAMIDTVVAIGNCTGAEIDKFAAMGLTARPASEIGAPLIDDCHASFECRLADGKLIDEYNYFIFECVKAHVAPVPRHPRTLHYTDGGLFMVAGAVVSRRARFKPDRL